MKKNILIYFFGIILIGFAMTSSSCSKKVGCPVNENVNAKSGKNGKMSKRRGNSNLFPKKMRKRK